jgi:hypothetical protein
METCSEEPERFYRSHSPGLGARILRGYGLTGRVPPSPPAAVGHAADRRRPLFPGLLLRLLAQINRRFLLRLAHPYREDNRPGVEGDYPSRFFEHNPPLVHVPEQPYGFSPWGTFARVQGHLLSDPGFQSRDFDHGLRLSSNLTCPILPESSRLELEAGCLYSPSCREGGFSETSFLTLAF